MHAIAEDRQHQQGFPHDQAPVVPTAGTLIRELGGASGKECDDDSFNEQESEKSDSEGIRKVIGFPPGGNCMTLEIPPRQLGKSNQ